MKKGIGKEKEQIIRTRENISLSINSDMGNKIYLLETNAKSRKVEKDEKYKEYKFIKLYER
ncbi:hypothetical protein PFDG_05098 [Plasmodium falciparum Dd2]|uniref:Uncharacterized protein n=1 Tax=Plasmodium falciparum (isolate Dd2) TaxID=57267 RepID=A0A0L7MAC4_PLAF4|nr:hypothetical protein PFDG_05098 [Plasmodium falciparum Dd2]